MNPEEDFLNWEFLFKDSFEDDEFTQYFKDFIRLVTLIVDKNQFPEEILEYKEHFINETIDSILSTIMIMSNIDYYDQDDVSQFIQFISFLVLKGFIKKINNFDKYVMLIFNKSQPIYKHENISLEIVTQFCYSQGAVKIITKEIEGKGGKVENKAAYLMLLTSFDNILKKEEISFTSFIEEIFEQYIKEIDKEKLRELDENMIKTVLLAVHKTLTKRVIFSTLNFVKLCMESEYYTKNKLGVSILFTIALKNCKEMMNEWIVENNFIEFLITHEYHDDIMENFANKFIFIVSNIEISKDLMTKLWKRIITSKFQKKVLSKIFFSCVNINKLTIDEVNEFFDDKECDQSTKIVVLKTGVKHAKNIKGECLFLLLDIIDPNDAGKEVSSIIKDIKNESTLIKIFNSAFEKIKANEKIHQSLLIIKKLSQVYYSISDNIEEIINKIIEFTANEEEKVCAYKILTKFAIATETKLSVEQIKEIVKNDRNMGFNCIANLVNTDGFQDFSEETKEYILETLKGIKLGEYTKEVIDLFFYFIIAEGKESEDIIVSERTEQIIKITTTEIKDIDLLQNAMMSAEDEEIATKAQNYLIKLISKISVAADKKIKYLLDKYSHYLEDGNTEQKVRVLQFIRKTAQDAECTFSLNDFKVKRHHEKKDPKEFPLEISVNNKNRIVLNVTPETKVEHIIYRLSIIYQVNEKKITLKKGKKKLMTRKTLKFEGITTRSLLKAEFIKNTMTRLKKSVTSTLSYNLLKEGFTTKLLNIIQDETADNKVLKEASNLLNFLPTDERLIESIKENITEVVSKKQSRRMQKYIFVAIYQALEDDTISLTEENKGIFIQIWNDLKDEKIDEKNMNSAALMFTQIPEIINELSDISIVSTFLTKEGKFKETSQLLFENVIECDEKHNIDLLCEADDDLLGNILQYDKETMENLHDIFDNTIYKGNLCNSLSNLLSMIEEVREPEYVLPLIASTYTETSETEAILDFCKEYVHDNKYVNGIAQVISLIFNYHSELIPQNRDIVKAVYPLFIKNCEENVDSDAKRIIIAAIRKDSKLQDIISEKLKEAFDFNYDSWDIDIGRDTKPLVGHTGLKNLCCTCYMNSVLQQVFANVSYRNSIISSKSKEPWIVALREIFTTMLLTLHSSVTTRPFCSTFLMHEVDPINVGYQMDAVEFLDTLIDQLNTAGIKNTQFKVIEKKTYTGVDNEFTQVQNSDCICINVPVKNTFEDFLENFSTPELISEYNTDKFSEPIKVNNVESIDVAPDTFVFQLNRFEYNRNKGEREKNNKYFEFPFEFDAKEMMTDKSSHVYDLKGVIIHNGVAEGGHYYSIIKEGNDWVEYNDTEVSIITHEEFAKSAYGSEYNTDYGAESAYVLFYNKVKEEKVEEEEPEFDPELQKMIIEDNQQTRRIRTAFSSSMLSLMGNITNINLLFDYTLNVFLHAKESSVSEMFFKHILSVIKKSKSLELTLKYLVDNAKKITKALSRDIPPQTKANFLKFLTNIITLSDPYDSAPFIIETLNCLPRLVYESWIQSACVFNLAIAFIEGDQEFVDAATVFELFDLIVKTTEEYIDNLPTSISKEKFDLSKLFSSLSNYTDLISGPVSLHFINNYMQIMLSNSKTAVEFCAFLVEVAENGTISFKEVVKRILEYAKANPAMSNEYMKYIYTQCRDSQVAIVTKEFVDQMTNGKVLFTKFMAECAFDQRMIASFIDYPRDTICSFIDDKSKTVRINAERAFYKCFNKFEKIPLDCFVEKLVIGSVVDGDYYTNPPPTDSDIENLSEFIDPIIEKLQEAVASGKETFGTPMRFCPLIRIALFIADNTGITDKFLTEIWNLMKETFNIRVDVNCNLLQILVSLNLLDDDVKDEFAQQHCSEIFSALFPLSFENRAVTPSIFYAFFSAMGHYLCSNPNEFKRIISENSFLASYREVIPISSQKQFADFLELLGKVKDEQFKETMKNKMGDQIENISQYLPDSKKEYEKLFNIESNDALFDSIETLFEGIDDPYFDGKIIDDLLNKDLSIVIPSLTDLVHQGDLIATSSPFIIKTAPFFAKACQYKEFKDLYITYVIKNIPRKMFWYYIAHLCKISNEINAEDETKIEIIKLMTKNLQNVNIIIKFPVEEKQTFIDFFNSVYKDQDELIELIMTLTETIYQHKEITEIIMSYVMRQEKANRKDIYLMYADAYRKAEGKELVAIIRIISDVIEIDPEAKDIILDALKLTDESFSFWPEEAFQYVNSFLR